jgi:hypothetical protein
MHIKQESVMASPAKADSEKVKEFKHSRPIGAAGVLGQSWQTCAEADRTARAIA